MYKHVRHVRLSCIWVPHSRNVNHMEFVYDRPRRRMHAHHYIRHRVIRCFRESIQCNAKYGWWWPLRIVHTLSMYTDEPFCSAHKKPGQ